MASLFRGREQHGQHSPGIGGGFEIAGKAEEQRLDNIWGGRKKTLLKNFK